MGRKDGEGVQLCKAQRREKFARWLCLTIEVLAVVGVVAVVAVRVRSTGDEVAVGVSGICSDAVVDARVRLTADSELICVSRECLRAMVAVVDDSRMVGLRRLISSLC